MGNCSPSLHLSTFLGCGEEATDATTATCEHRVEEDARLQALGAPWTPPPTHPPTPTHPSAGCLTFLPSSGLRMRHTCLDINGEDEGDEDDDPHRFY